MISADHSFMRLALNLARRGFGATSPNPMVGAVLVNRGRIIGRGWHHRAGEPHAEIEAIRNAQRGKDKVAGSTLYVTLEPCSTHGRTPPCTGAIRAAGIKRVVVAAIDPNPAHAGKGLELLRRGGIQVLQGMLESEAISLNEAFNHWIVHRIPFVTVKAAMSLDGRIATKTGDSKWITGPKARAYGMKLRQGADAILVGVNTVLADNPGLTWRGGNSERRDRKPLRRIILDSHGRTPLNAQVASDPFAAFTTVVVTKAAPKKHVAALAKRVNVWVGPKQSGRINLYWLLERLGAEEVTSLLVEGGGEINAAFFLERLAQRVAFFYAPKIIGGNDAIRAVSGAGFRGLQDATRLDEVQWRQLGPDLLLTARC